ncbi:hypothetical protein [Ornithinibacillus halophilus]|uniref:Uncharacterized protein n=1 Tax=Ornithinibacillus halophilus TaxID=930117 RepID=A0A1M5KUH6_9BACI|nr:hypothetical protein [Ornithinibacillus halophilus]SHG56395.1 hypothetical protein SAMN05216225_104123 [Ornithinibacillus halophilus]
MTLGKQMLLTIAIFTVSAVIIELLLRYFDPSINDFFRSAITSSPILISLVLTNIISNRVKKKTDDQDSG